jgi:predicted membrane channel-forming protein YqfA (hemolysin III family)
MLVEFDWIAHSVIVLVCGTSLAIVFELLSIKYTLPFDGSIFTELNCLVLSFAAELLPADESEEFDWIAHSVIVLVCGTSLAIVFELLSIKYTLPEE